MNIVSNGKKSQQGLSLVELMIAMTIGIIMVGGAFYVYSGTRSAYVTNENFALMQENARFALSLMEPDIQLAGFWGNHKNFDAIDGRADTRTDVLTVANDCADNWIVQLDQYVEGANNLAPVWPCFPVNRYIAQTDVLTLRRAGTEVIDTADLVAGQTYLRSSELPLSEVFIGTTEPVGLPTRAENFELVARSYYVSSYTAGNDTNNDAIPSLRRLELVERAGAPAIVDSEVIPGVENMQVQYGVDLTDDGINKVEAYVTADNPLLTSAFAEIRAVRIWLLMRAENPELGHVDDIDYLLGDQPVTAANDAFRRAVVSRTIFLRNR